MQTDENFYQNNSCSSTMFNKYNKSNGSKNLNDSPRNTLNNITDNKIIKNLKANIDISKPLTSIRSTCYSTQRNFSDTNHKLNDFPSKYFSNTITSKKQFKKNKNLNKRLTVNTNANYSDNIKIKKIFEINNKIFVDNLKIKDKKENKDYTNLLISKTETQYPITTYYLSPVKNYSGFSIYNNLFTNKKESNCNYINNSYEFNIKNNFNNIFTPKGIKITKNKSESKNNVFFSKSNGFNNCKYLYSFNESKYNTLNKELINEYFKHFISKKNYIYGRYSTIKRKGKGLKEIIIILEKIMEKKILKTKEKFFINLNRINKIDFLTLNNNNNINSNDFYNAIFSKKRKINKKLNLKNMSRLQNSKDFIKNIYLNKKNNEPIYIPKKKSLNNVKNISKIYTSKNNKQQIINTDNNYLKIGKARNLKNIFSTNLRKEKQNKNFKNIHHKNIFSLDNLNNKVELNQKIYNKSKKTNEKNSSLGIVYQKKLGRNTTDKKFSKKPKLILNDNLFSLNNEIFFNFNYGMLIDYIVSNDHKLNINVKYVVFINKYKNIISNNLTRFIKSNLKIDKTDNFNIISNTFVELGNIEINKIKNFSGVIKTKKKVLFPEKKKNGMFYIKSKKYFFSYLKIKSLSILLKKYLYSFFLNKLKNIRRKKYNINGKKEILNSKNDLKNNASIIIKVKKAKIFQKKNDRKIDVDKFKEKIININKKLNLKIVEKCFSNWKKNNCKEKKIQENENTNKNNNDSEQFKNNNDELISILIDDLFLVRIELICFALRCNK